eukprot:TRINITY_DN11335_c0_g1_i1.p1 TRINITY_DN11335_c0_g1~~TRINITY_DN11335_c0_g1_i1.p1  ORF type:complete len:562 (-),score=141.00 TRINITY_DN11335_c0_g1_i1:40-1542(-)
MKEEFVAEVEIMAQVVHPHIVLLLGASTDERPWSMVTELMTRGDLHHILHEWDGELSLNRKLQFAIDISSGMAWLTGKEVKILHRDLKPGNVLVDQNWTCKICDFGLSFLESKGMVKGDAVGGGSPLWMSPEALLDEGPLTEKNDVYAFGLVLWEILTQKALFTEYTDIDIFTDDIARKGIRPSLEGVAEELQVLVKECWDKSQEVRPTFKDLITRIRKLRVDMNLPTSICPNAAKLWEKGNWLSHATVPLNDFMTVLYNFTKPPSDKEFYTRCISQIFFSQEMSLENFAKLLKWFGPLKQGEMYSILEIIYETVRQPWFFGELSREEAETRLDPYKASPGHYLVRLNSGSSSAIETCPYTISRVQDVDQIVHTRIQPSKNGGFFVKIGTTTHRGPSLRELISTIEQKNIPELSTVCPGHPFANIFTIKKTGKYHPVVNEEEESEEEEAPPPEPAPKKSSGSSKSKSSSKSSDKKKRDKIKSSRKDKEAKEKEAKDKEAK